MFQVLEGGRAPSAIGCVLACTVLSLSALGQTVRDKPHPAASPFIKVASLHDLEPTTPDLQAQAIFFEIGGVELREETVTRILGEEPPGVIPAPPGGFVGADPNTPDARLLAKICRSDAIFVGRVSRRDVFLNHVRTWLFTQYSTQVLKTIRPATLGMSVLVSQSGGEAEVNGKLIRTLSAPRLQGDRDYLFMVRKIPGSAALTPWGQPDDLGATLGDEGEALVEQVARLEASCDSRRD